MKSSFQVCFFFLPSSTLHQCWISVGVERNEALWGTVIGRGVFNMFYDKQLRIDDSDNYRHKTHIGCFFLFCLFGSAAWRTATWYQKDYLNLQSAYKTHGSNTHTWLMCQGHGMISSHYHQMSMTFPLFNLWMLRFQTMKDFCYCAHLLWKHIFVELKSIAVLNLCSS